MRADDGTEDVDERCTGTESCECDECLDDDPDEGCDCYSCGGEGWVPCDDPMQCTSAHNALGECECSSCGGSGRRRDMTIW